MNKKLNLLLCRLWSWSDDNSHRHLKTPAPFEQVSGIVTFLIVDYYNCQQKVKWN